jgi:hypothetical protein
MDLLAITGLLGNIGEFVGAIAVVGTLGYLAVQIRQNTEQIGANAASLEASTYQSLMAHIIDLNRVLAADSELSEIVVRIRAGEVPDGADMTRFVQHQMSLLRYGDMAFHQYEKGLLSAERLASAFGPVRGQVVGNDVAMQVFEWAVEQGSFVDEYVEFCRKEFRDFKPTGPASEYIRQAVLSAR